MQMSKRRHGFLRKLLSVSIYICLFFLFQLFKFLFFIFLVSIFTFSLACPVNKQDNGGITNNDAHSDI